MHCGNKLTMNTNNHSETKVAKLFLSEQAGRPAIKAPKQSPQRFLELLAETVESASAPITCSQVKQAP